jgi:transposase
MNLHANAALSWTGRRRLCELVVDDGWTVTAAARAAGVSVRCARKWVGRYRLEGVAGLRDRSSAPRRVANRTAPDRVEVIVKLRRLRFTAGEIAETLEMALSTVSGILTRSGMGRLGRLGLEPAVRYEHSRPGELLHIDVKKLGRITRPGHRVTGDRSDRRDQGKKGWEYVHIAIDDYTRLAYAEVLNDETAVTIIGSCAAPSLSTSATASGSSDCSPTTAAATAQRSTRSLARLSASATAAPAPTGHRQTGRQSVSSAPCSTAGPTARSTDQAKNAHALLTAGSGTTTIDADTQPSATSPRSAEPTCSGLTARAADHRDR